MTTTRQTLDVPLEKIFVYSDSTTVIAWLDGTPKRYTIYKANRIATTVDLIPTKSWRYVPTKENPADPASRGTTAAELKYHHLWWHGPSWLVCQPIKFPKQPSEAEINKLKEEGLRPLPCNITTIIAEDLLESRFNSYNKMLRVIYTIRRLAQFIKTKEKPAGEHLTTQEAREATLILVQRSQKRSFPTEVNSLLADSPKDISQRSSILILHPTVDDKNVLRVGGRFERTNLPQHVKHPVILSAKDKFTRLLFRHYHLELGHCGPTALLAHSGNIYHVVGARKLSREICSKCIICRKAAAKATNQLLGQLPPERVEPDFVFYHTGMDFAGPFKIRQGHTRKPVFIDAHLAIFICFSTKAVHLELVSDQTTVALLAAIDRFSIRRGLPLHLHSDNGPNYTGAKNQLSKFYQMLRSKETDEAIQNYAFSYNITWHNIPQRAPHFGGLWEAAVKGAKYHLKRIVGDIKFTFEELYTIVCKVESYMNSRPLGPLTSHSIDGLSPLTPSHFLIGRAARAYPREKIEYNPTLSQRWLLCQKAAEQFWDQWSNQYLQQLNKAVKWHKRRRNYQVGDIVMLTDGVKFQCQWSLAKVIAIYPGKDGVDRAVDVQIETKVIPPNCNTKEELARKITTKTHIFRRPVCKISMLLAVDEVPAEGISNEETTLIDEL